MCLTRTIAALVGISFLPLTARTVAEAAILEAISSRDCGLLQDLENKY